MNAEQALEEVASPGNIWDVKGASLLSKLRALGFDVLPITPELELHKAMQALLAAQRTHDAASRAARQ